MVRIECYQAVLGALIPLPLHKIELDVEVRIFVLLIQSPAILYNLLNFGLARCGSLFVRRNRILGGAGFPGGVNGSSFGIEVVREDCGELARVLGREVFPESVNALLRRDSLAGLLWCERRA